MVFSETIPVIITKIPVNPENFKKKSRTDLPQIKGPWQVNLEKSFREHWRAPAFPNFQPFTMECCLAIL